jgi:tRNA nucleotidyltransferase (CCA-adding enzyme)
MGYPLYVVGGFVRDLLLGEPNLDMDLVVEGDAIRFARWLARQLGARSRSHKRFGTAKVILEGREEELGIPSLDFATARLEFYSHSAALPEVERSSIKADLHRRDFTINTLALRLDSGHYGTLLDFYGGEHDLKDGLIRVLHSLSFIEDPTRIMRAARFEQRLGFTIEPRTEELIENALPMLARVTGERIRHELYLILEEQRPERVLGRLDALGVLSRIHSRLSCSERTCGLFAALRHAVTEEQWRITAVEDGRPEPGLYLAMLIYDFSREELEALARRLKFFRQDMTLLHQVVDLREREESLEQPDLSNQEIYALLKHSSSEARLVRWLVTESEQVKRRLWRFETELQYVEPMVDGEYLKSLGLKPSPLFSRLLRSVRDARLDGEVHTLEEEKALIDRLLAERDRA